MKKLIAAIIAITSFSASSMNMQIGYPVDASRMSLSGHVNFSVDCSSKSITFNESTSYIFEKHIKRNVHVMCYKDYDSHIVSMSFDKGKLGRDSMISSQTSRYMRDDIKVN